MTILRRGSTRTLFDHGPHGYLSLAAHGHADALRVDVSRGGQELIVDPGVGSYFARTELREFEKTPEQHGRALRIVGLRRTLQILREQRGMARQCGIKVVG